MNSTYPEAARGTPLTGDYDVVVCGGGLAGIASAIASARQGARTALIEVHGCLGGVWTAGLLSWILDSANKPGLLTELLARLDARGARQPMRWTGVAYDVEQMKLMLEEMCLEAGVFIRLHTRIVAAGRDANNRLAVAITESKSGREAWTAKVFVDATGDGDLAAQAGCGIGLGRPGDGKMQPMTLMAMLGGIHYNQVQPFVHDESTKWREDTNGLLQLLAERGVEPSYGAPILIRIHDDLFALMANHEYGVSSLDAAQITHATLRARAEVHRLVNALRSCGGVWRDVKIVATGAQIGVREGRRIHGLYQVTTDDLIRGTRHKDAVCRVTFPVDLHIPSPDEGNSYSNEGIKAQPYDIPLRALIAKDVDSLLLAGRCISGDFIAHSSYRVTGNAVAMGEAAGCCAAYCAHHGVLPRETDASLIFP